MNNPPFPGATEFSVVSLYDDLGTSVCGGTPHLHTACTEAYIGMNGEATVEVLSSDGHHAYPVSPGQVVWFTPGVIHRGVPKEGPADVLVLMQNAGLPEAGDAVLTLPSRFWDRPEEYASLVSLIDVDGADRDEMVRRRRALAVEGYQELMTRYDAEGSTGLDPFYDYARAVVAPHLDAMTELVHRTAAAEVSSTLGALAEMKAGTSDHLHLGRASHTTHGGTRHGMCGMLRPFKFSEPEQPPS